ncbi:MAG: XRE family transcriptional regulator [Methanobrevibacter sp.]|jgi:transcriptional regulator with XRE-family HTH domain|nr:XRE family transcriptional regulator [Candidatus Methanovirga procula]
MKEKNSIGAKIKEIRKLKNMTIEELSNKSELSLDLIRNIENGESIPSLSPLTKISKTLGVRLGTFLDDDLQNGPIVSKDGVFKKAVHFSGEEGKTTSSALDFYSLGSGKSDRNMEPFVIDVYIEKGDFELSSHEGEEFIFVLEGSIEIKYGKDTYILNEKDSIYYDSIVPHHLHSYNGKSKILAVLYSPLVEQENFN